MNDVEAKFDAIDWNALNLAAVHAFYEACGRPLEQRALLMAINGTMSGADWRRSCLADLAAMQNRACPSCVS